MPRAKTDDDVLLDRWLEKPTEEIKHRVLVLALNKIRALQAEARDFEGRLREMSEI